MFVNYGDEIHHERVLLRAAGNGYAFFLTPDGHVYEERMRGATS